MTINFHAMTDAELNAQIEAMIGTSTAPTIDPVTTVGWYQCVDGTSCFMTWGPHGPRGGHRLVKGADRDLYLALCDEQRERADTRRAYLKQVEANEALGLPAPRPPMDLHPNEREIELAKAYNANTWVNPVAALAQTLCLYRGEVLLKRDLGTPQ